jgi:catechol 2,3-dioxygenase-like lactoylglutathione lyase family enzyme
MSDQRPVPDQVNIVTRDMDASLAFYRRLGLEIPDRDPKWDPHHRSANSTGMDFDIDSLAYAQEWDHGWPGAVAEGRGGGGSVVGGSVIGFRLASRAEVDRVFADLTAAGYPGQQEPYDAPWGARFAVVEDPDGNAVGLMSPKDPAMRRDSDPPS